MSQSALVLPWLLRTLTTVVVALVLVACAGSEAGNGDDLVVVADDSMLDGLNLRIGVGLSTEQRVLAALMAEAAMAAGAGIETVEQPMTTDLRDALERGEIDLYWDRSRRVWEDELGSPASIDPDATSAIAAADRNAHNVAWLPEAGYGSGFAAVGSAETLASTGGLSFAAVISSPTPPMLCMTFETGTDELVRGALERSLGRPLTADDWVEVDQGQILLEVEEIGCLGLVGRVDPRLSGAGLELLDDGGVFGTDTPVVIVVAETTTSAPELVAILAEIPPLLSERTMQQLIAQVELDGASPSEAARGFLVATAIIDG